MKIYNEENLLIDLEELFKNQYGLAVIGINEDHLIGGTDPFYIAEIPVQKFVFDTFSDINRSLDDFFLLYGFMDNDVVSPDQYPARTSTISFQVGYFDSGLSNRRNLFFKTLRYRQAMLNMLDANEHVFRGYSKIRIDKLLPRSFAYDKRSDLITGGVNISAELY